MTDTRFQVGDIVDYHSHTYKTYLRVLLLKEEAEPQGEDQTFVALFLIHTLNGVRQPAKENRISRFFVWNDGTDSRYTLFSRPEITLAPF